MSTCVRLPLSVTFLKSRLVMVWWSSLKKSDQIELFTQQAARAGVGKNRGFKFGREDQ